MSLPPVDGSPSPSSRKPSGAKKRSSSKKAGGRTVSIDNTASRASVNPKKKKRKQGSRRTIEEYRKKQLFDVVNKIAPSVSPEEYKQVVDEAFKHPKGSWQFAIGHYLEAVKFYMIEEPKQALEHAETFYKAAKDVEDKELYPLACYWLGKIKLTIDNHLGEEILELFETAYKHGVPIAGKFVMHAHLGTEAHLSLIKWCNPLRTLKIAQELSEQFKDQPYKMLNLAKSCRTDRLKMMFLNRRLETETSNSWDMNNLTYLYVTQLIDLFCTEEAQLPALILQIEDTFKQFQEQNGDNLIIQAPYHRALLSIKGHNQESIDFLSESPFPVCQLLAGDYYEKSDAPEKAREFYKNCLSMINGYSLVAESFLRQNNFPDALKAYQDGIEHLQGFLEGKEPLFFHFSGDQSQALRTSNLSLEHATELAYEEQYAVHEYINLFQANIDILEEAIDEQTRSKKVITPPEFAPGQQGGDSSPDEEYFDSRDTTGHPLSTPSTDSDEYQSAVENLSDLDLKDSDFTLVTDPGKKKVRRKHLSSEKLPERWEIKQKIRNADDLAKKKKLYDAAIEQLEALQVPRETPEWFMQQQALIWIYRSKGMQMTNETEENTKKGHEILLQTEQNVKKLIHLLAQKAEGQPPLEEPAGDIPIADTIESCLAVADKLDTIDPQLRKQYGGLYSSLAHLQKSIRQSPCKGKKGQFYYKKGVHYYDLANHIRKRTVEKSDETPSEASSDSATKT